MARAARRRKPKGDDEVSAIKIRNLVPELRPIDELRPDPQNARTHTAEQIRGLAAAIQQFGWTVPVILNGKGLITAGHGRVEAARLLGIEAVPTVVIDDWTEEERLAYMIADNRLAENAGWDWDRVKANFADLEAAGFDLTLTGFDIGDISQIMSPQTPAQLDRSVAAKHVQYQCPKCHHKWSGKAK